MVGRTRKRILGGRGGGWSVIGCAWASWESRRFLELRRVPRDCVGNGRDDDGGQLGDSHEVRHSLEVSLRLEVGFRHELCLGSSRHERVLVSDGLEHRVLDGLGLIDDVRRAGVR